MLLLQPKKNDYNKKINEIENKIRDRNNEKYITTPQFKRLTIANFVKKDSFDEKLKTIISNKNE